MTCKKCGSCCKQLTFSIPGISQKRDQIIYYKAHGCQVVGDLIIVPIICPHLTEDNLCDIHEKKPFLCKQYKGGGKGFYTPDSCKYHETE